MVENTLREAYMDKTMRTYTKYEINLALEDANIWSAHMLDERYVLTTEEYLLNEGMQAYHSHLANIIDCSFNELYESDIFDCEDFAIGYRQFIVMMHRRYHSGVTAGLAVGFGIHRTLHHALNIVTILEEGELCVKVYEPQKSGEYADISESLYYSGFSLVLL
jgi:phage shock protein PspC (stress-responsive transcriptional regulator)